MMPDREKVIKGLEVCFDSSKECNGCPYITTPYCKTTLRNDVTALLKEQEAKTGHWIEQEDYVLDTYYDCSVCGESWSTIEGTPWENGMNYCPHCGAKMEGR